MGAWVMRNKLSLGDDARLGTEVGTVFAVQDYGDFELVLFRVVSWGRKGPRPFRGDDPFWMVVTWETAPTGIAVIKYFDEEAPARDEFERLNGKIPRLLAVSMFGIELPDRGDPV